MNYKELEGDLIALANKKLFDVIVHGCNCFCRMKRGIAPQMANSFGCDTFNLERPGCKGDINKLGQIDYELKFLENIEDEIYWTKYSDERDIRVIHSMYVVNAYTQYNWDTNTKPFDYDAFTLCMKKINHLFGGKTVGMPKIGSHLAGGDWDKIKKIIKNTLTDVNVIVVIYKP